MAPLLPPLCPEAEGQAWLTAFADLLTGPALAHDRRSVCEAVHGTTVDLTERFAGNWRHRLAFHTSKIDK